MKKIFFFILAILLMLISGCSYTNTDIQELMMPPRLTGDEAKIQNAISESANNKSHTFKYPQRGDYRSAIIMYDIDGDGMNEAIAFYQMDFTEVNDINIVIIDQKDDQWEQIAMFKVPASDIDKVSFSELCDDKQTEVVISYKAYNNSIENKMLVLSCANNSVKVLDLNYTCSDFITMDFDNDNIDEILLLSLSTQNKDALARLIKYSDVSTSLENAGQTKLDPTVTKYLAISTGLISQNQVGIVIDSISTEYHMASEIIYWDKQKQVLEAPLSSNDNKGNVTERFTKTISSDIDGNGIIEVPITFPMMGYSYLDIINIDDNVIKNKREMYCYITQWSNYDPVSKGFIENEDMVINEYDNYYLKVPNTWESEVIGIIDIETNSLIFSDWDINDAGIGAAGSAILKIKVFDEEVWELNSEDNRDFQELERANEKVYAVSILQPNNKNALTFDKIKEGFGLKSFGIEN